MELNPEQVFGIAGLTLDAVDFDDDRHRWVVELHSVISEPFCPTCGQPSSHRHSTYRRTLADVPCGGYQTLWRLTTRRHFCRNPACSQRIFAERFPSLAAPFARTSSRLIDLFRSLGLSAGGRGGARLATTLAMPVDRTTLLRIVRHTPIHEVTSVRVLGIDDWAYRKGLTYGTVLVDLEAHRIVDLLPDRSAASVADWLRRHPGVQIITRDRASVYADGARQGAPEAVQIADRWHLLKNLKEAVQTALLLWQSDIRKNVGGATAPPTDLDVETNERLGTPDPSAPAVQSLPIQAGKQVQFDRIHVLRQAGWTIQAIAADVGRSRNTVRKYAALDVCPAPQHRERPSKVDPFKAVLLERFRAGCQNARVLWEELRAQGYTGGAATVKAFLAPFRGQEVPQRDRSPPLPRRPSLTTLACLLVKIPERRTPEEQRWTQQLATVCSETEVVVTLAQQFAAMVRQGEAHELGTWLRAATASGIAALKGFARGIWNDLSAVQEGIVQPWSNGPVEGHVNKLKTIKRQMYGRAKLDLLRARLLAR